MKFCESLRKAWYRSEVNGEQKALNTSQKKSYRQVG